VGRAALLVGDPVADPLVPALAERLGAAGVDVRVVRPDDVVSLSVDARADRCEVDGAEVDVVAFRAHPTLLDAPAFDRDDRSFAAAEVRALWLHVLTLPAVTAMNRSDAELWFLPSEWPVWRRRFAAAGVPLAPLRVGVSGGEAGDAWWTWTGALTRPPPASVAAAVLAPTVEGPVARALWCAGDVVDGPAPAAAVVEAAGAVLDGAGIVLAGLVLDGAGRLVGASSFPTVPAAVAAAVADRVVDHLLRGSGHAGPAGARAPAGVL
jgi:hypothetical protein